MVKLKTKSNNHQGHKGLRKVHKNVYYNILTLCALGLPCLPAGRFVSFEVNDFNIYLINLAKKNSNGCKDRSDMEVKTSG